jgi:hypothetical protein
MFNISQNLAEKPATGCMIMDAQKPKIGFSVSISLSVAESEAAARDWSLRLTRTPGGKMPVGSPSGRKIGQEVWRSWYPKGEVPQGMFQLLARDGRSVVLVQLMYTVLQTDIHNRPLHRIFTAADLRFAENQAIACLNRLTQMGYTSRSAKKPAD